MAAVFRRYNIVQFTPVYQQKMLLSIICSVLPWVPEDIFFLSISWRRSCVNEEENNYFFPR